ncbi:MAG: CapA family protein, partial [Armatimonadota bacterium]
PISQAADISGRITIAVVGDVLLGGKVRTPAERVAESEPLLHVQSVLGNADVAFCNLECPISARGTPTPLKTPGDLAAKREFLFRGIPQAAKVLASAGFDVVSIANNHILDYGEEALEDTIAHLRSVNVKHCGAGKDLEAARTPAVIEVGNTRIAILSYVWAGTLPDTCFFEAGRPGSGCAMLHTGEDGRLSEESAEILAEDLRAARALADFVIVSVHWGIERMHRPCPWQRKLARLMIDRGADAIIGHHPHVLQGIEVYNGKPILYSLGNFVFPSIHNANNDSCIAILTIEGGDAFLEIRPVRIQYGVPQLPTGEESMRIGRFIASLSWELGTAATVRQDGTLLVPLVSKYAPPKEP